MFQFSLSFFRKHKGATIPEAMHKEWSSIDKLSIFGISFSEYTPSSPPNICNSIRSVYNSGAGRIFEFFEKPRVANYRIW